MIWVSACLHVSKEGQSHSNDDDNILGFHNMRPTFDFGLGIKWCQFVGYLLSKVDYNT